MVKRASATNRFNRKMADRFKEYNTKKNGRNHRPFFFVVRMVLRIMPTLKDLLSEQKTIASE